MRLLCGADDLSELPSLAGELSTGERRGIERGLKPLDQQSVREDLAVGRGRATRIRRRGQLGAADCDTRQRTDYRHRSLEETARDTCATRGPRSRLADSIGGRASWTNLGLLYWLPHVTTQNRIIACKLDDCLATITNSSRLAPRLVIQDTTYLFDGETAVSPSNVSPDSRRGIAPPMTVIVTLMTRRFGRLIALAPAGSERA